MSKETVGRTHISISATDLVLAKDTIASHGWNYVLDQIGFDVNQPIEEEMKEHRNRQGNIVNATLFIGYERTDAEWLAGDLASDEVKLMVRNDPSYNREIAKISRRAF